MWALNSGLLFSAIVQTVSDERGRSISLYWIRLGAYVRWYFRFGPQITPLDRRRHLPALTGAFVDDGMRTDDIERTYIGLSGQGELLYRRTVMRRRRLPEVEDVANVFGAL